MVSECAHVVNDSKVWLAEQLRKKFLDFTRCHCLQQFPLFLDKMFLAVQSSKESYLPHRLYLDASFVVFLAYHQIDEEMHYLIPGADPAFVIRGGPNSEHFLSNVRKLLKRGKFLLTTQSFIVKKNWVYINQFIKTCFL